MKNQVKKESVLQIQDVLDDKIRFKKNSLRGSFFMQLDIYLKDLSYRQSAQHSQFLLSLHPAHHNSEQT